MGRKKYDRESRSARTMRLRARRVRATWHCDRTSGERGITLDAGPARGPDGKHRTRVSPTAGGALQLSRIYCATSAKEGSQDLSFVRKCEADEGRPSEPACRRSLQTASS